MSEQEPAQDRESAAQGLSEMSDEVWKRSLDLAAIVYQAGYAHGMTVASSRGGLLVTGLKAELAGVVHELRDVLQKINALTGYDRGALSPAAQIRNQLSRAEAIISRLGLFASDAAAAPAPSSNPRDVISRALREAVMAPPAPREGTR